MSIKGTLETFNLCELLQMLAFNQKEGTLVLEGEEGSRTVFIDEGRLTFLEKDTSLAKTLTRMARFHEVADEAQLADALERSSGSGRNLATTLESMGLIDDEMRQFLHRESVLEQLFECQLTAVAGFEFLEGKAVGSDGAEGLPIQPLLPVESLLLDLARMLDHHNTIAAVVPGPGEIYEGTGIAVDLAEDEDVDPALAEVVVPLIDGRRSLEQIATQTHATPYGVMQIAAALFEGGGVRAVPTDDLMRRGEDLLAQGEAVTTIALFKRCIDRGDASLDVRLRLADALEASGQPEAAAVELDTFAALSDDEQDAPIVFEALSRALKLRSGDLATAARTCDFYLRRRPWLQEYSNVAAQALRDLISAATTTGRPTDAALRLQGFIDCGDAPGEDRVLLADLYAAGGARKEAAEALYRRAEDLLATDRTGPARQLLRRALELDPGHADARRRKMELEGVRRRRGHRARIALILLALGGVASAMGVAWFGFQDTSSTELVDAQSQAEMGYEDAESRAQALISAFELRANKVADEGLRDAKLGKAAETMRAQVREVMAGSAKVIETYAAAIGEAQAAGQVSRHREALGRLEHRAAGVTRQAAEAVDVLAERARTSLGLAHGHLTNGEFEAAGKVLRAAWSLSFHDAPTRDDAQRKLSIVNEYMKLYKAADARMAELTAEGDLQGAFAAGVEAIGELLDSDLTRKLKFPVRIATVPAGAKVWLGDEDTGLTTPCVLPYSPFADEPTLRLRMGGRTTATKRLPSFDSMRRDPAALVGYEPKVDAALAAGPRWTISDETDHFRALWAGSGLPLVCGGRGHEIYAVAGRDGELTRIAGLDRSRDCLRLAGRLDGRVEWHVTGHRTLTVRPPRGDAWEQVTAGRIERAPVLLGGHIVLVDELGTLYAFAVSTGGKSWKVDLPAPPSQAPRVGKGGILIATVTGGAFRIAVKDGTSTTLAPAARGPALALPLGDHVAVLGGGKGGCRLVDADGVVQVLGDASPAFAHLPWLSKSGIAWVGNDGAVHWLAAGAKAPRKVAALGAEATHVTGGEGMLFATGADGRMRAVNLTKPDVAAWTAPMGGTADSAPVRLGDTVYVLVGGRLVAFDA